MLRNKALPAPSPDTLMYSCEKIVTLVQQARQRAFQSVNDQSGDDWDGARPQEDDVKFVVLKVK